VETGWRHPSQIKPAAAKGDKAEAADATPVERSDGKNNKTVYVGNLSWEIEEETLEAKLEVQPPPPPLITCRFLPSSSRLSRLCVRQAAGCKVKGIRWGEDKASGEFRGWGHVDLEDDESVVKAVSLNGADLLGRPMRVSFAVERIAPPKPAGPQRKLPPRKAPVQHGVKPRAAAPAKPKAAAATKD
jgi:RNA recognition motif-containing protein